jgi:rhodanese-related sulfurtransferase
MARISVDELHQLLQQGAAPTIVDVRSPLSQDEGRIPGAMTMSVEDLTPPILDTTYDGEVVVYCACPNEASAARVAKRLMQMGYSHVRPLTGGIDAWIAAGYSVESGGNWQKGN